MKFFGRTTHPESEIDTAERAVKPDLEKAGITTVMRAGKVIPIAAATLAEKFTALLMPKPPCADLQEHASEQTISNNLETLESDLAITQTSIARLQHENEVLTIQLETENARVAGLTEQNALIKEQVQAVLKEVNANNGILTAQKTALALRCLACGCLDLKDSNGVALAADATAAVKLEAALNLSFDDLIRPYHCAVTSALAKINQ